MTFRALLVTGDEGGSLVELDDDYLDGDITVDVEFSSVNFKDGLALTGKPGVISKPPLVAGIDLVGRADGERVLVNGWGIGEKYDGGLAERAAVASEWLVPVPPAFSNRQAAAIGTAGFTAMLAVLAIEQTAASAGADSTILVTGAAGGVGSIAVAVLANLGYHVTASTGRESEHDYLRSLGAAEIIDRHELSDAAGKPLQQQRWAAAIDSVGGTTLTNVLAQTAYDGIVASCGLAQSAKLDTTVMPFILRGVTLTGINSVYCPRGRRLEAWERLATDLPLPLLDAMTETVGLADARDVAERILAGGVRGRTVVDVRN